MQLKGKLLGDFLTNAPSHGGGHLCGDEPVFLNITICRSLILFCAEV